MKTNFQCSGPTLRRGIQPAKEVDNLDFESLDRRLAFRFRRPERENGVDAILEELRDRTLLEPAIRACEVGGRKFLLDGRQVMDAYYSWDFFAGPVRLYSGYALDAAWRAVEIDMEDLAEVEQGANADANATAWSRVRENRAWLEEALAAAARSMASDHLRCPSKERAGGYPRLPSHEVLLLPDVQATRKLSERKRLLIWLAGQVAQGLGALAREQRSIELRRLASWLKLPTQISPVIGALSQGGDFGGPSSAEYGASRNRLVAEMWAQAVDLVLDRWADVHRIADQQVMDEIERYANVANRTADECT